MKRASAPALVLTASLAVLAGCSRPAATTAPVTPPTPPGQPVSVAEAADPVADVNGTPITRAELDQQAEKELSKLRQQEYEIRKEALDELIAERLIAAEAKARGLGREALLQQEVEARIPAPAPAQVQTIYEQNKDRFVGQTPEQASQKIREVMTERARTQRRAAYEQELRARAKVTTRLDAPRTALSLPADAPAIGPVSAPITMVEYTDYQCPYCHRAQAVTEEVLSRYAGKVHFVHMDFPLEGHPRALPAARAARCAGEQGKFWEYHKSLMSGQGTFDDADLKQRAATLGLNPGNFATCLASSRHDASIQAQTQHGAEIGVTGTPAYFINGRMVSGARPFEAFAEIIDAELKRGS